MSYWFDDGEPQPLVPEDQRRRPPEPDVSIPEILQAGVDHATYIANTAGEAWLRERAYDDRIDAVFKATGVRLENPTRAVITSGEAIEQLRAAGLPVERNALKNRDAAMQLMARQFEERRRELADGLPDLERAKRAAIAPDRSIEDDMRALDERTRAASARALAAENVPAVIKWPTYLAGAMAGSLRAPENLLGLVVGGPAAGATRTAAGAILRAGVREAVVNAATETMAQPIIAKWRTDLGVPANTPREMLADIGTAALFGGILGGGLEAGARGLRALSRPDAPPIERGMAGDDDALIAAVREAGDAAPPEIRAAADALEADRLVQARVPEGMAPDESALLLSAAMRRAEEPDAPLPRPDEPETYLPAVAPPPDGGTALDGAIARLDAARRAYDAIPVDDVSARRAAMAEMDNADAALRALGEGLDDRDPAIGKLGELANIVRRDLPDARGGQGGPEELLRLENRRQQLMGELSQPAPAAAPARRLTPSDDISENYPDMPVAMGADGGVRMVSRDALGSDAPRFTELAAAVAACRV
ncbi:hypothetical protein [Ancylobacter sp. IITR112]|uniref:hypothetical protein n=1 Tax=Ancylobacter sp. IITR112 TaxID=3138073 RepID=UPI00352B4E00